MNTFKTLFAVLLLLHSVNICAENSGLRSGVDRSGQTIYSFEVEPPIEHNRGRVSAGPVEIHKIVVVSETPDEVEFSLTYTYDFEVPIEQVRIFLGVGMDFFRGSYKQAQKGTHTVNLKVLLDSKRLKEKTGKSENSSSYIWFSFDQYETEKYSGWFYKSEFYFPKVWKTKPNKSKQSDAQKARARFKGVTCISETGA